jgi:hypothetical protein
MHDEVQHLFPPRRRRDDTRRDIPVDGRLPYRARTVPESVPSCFESREVMGRSLFRGAGVRSRIPVRGQESRRGVIKHPPTANRGSVTHLIGAPFRRSHRPLVPLTPRIKRGFAGVFTQARTRRRSSSVAPCSAGDASRFVCRSEGIGHTLRTPIPSPASDFQCGRVRA